MATEDPVLKSTEAADRQAFDAIKQQRDAAMAERDTATKALDVMMKVHDASKALVGKVADPFAVAEMISNQLTDVKREDVATHVTSEAFAPKLAAFKAAEAPPPPPQGEGEGEGEGSTPPPIEPPAGFGGPSPGQATGTQAINGQQPIVAGSQEWRDFIASNDEPTVKKAYDDGRIVSPARSF